MTTPQTLVDALTLSLAAAMRSPDGVADPSVLLWTDADGEWRPLISALRKTSPHIYTLGAYDPAAKSGPPIWLKCVVDRALPDVAPPYGQVPILYLPGVSRQDLRAGGDCPPRLQPLIELQYRGAVWHQKNGRDWTVEAFLVSESGLGLDVTLDARTREAIVRSLPALAVEPVQSLRGRRLDADDFDRLTVGDPIRDLLSWMAGPESFQSRCDPGRWQTFKTICVRDFQFDPERDGPLGAADALLNKGGRWEEVWRRFRDAPRAYAGVADLLRSAKPNDLLTDQSRQPQVNETQEMELRYALGTAAGLPHAEACQRIVELESRHRERRAWVWAELGQSTLAQALEPLSRLAKAAQATVGGVSAAAMAADYAAGAWRCDRAAIDSLMLPKAAADLALVTKVVDALYAPWLDKSARHFQELVFKNEADYRKAVGGVQAEAETCVLFADGLRFDIGAMLHERLEARGYRAKLTHRLAPVPTVTATAKPMASPAYGAVEGGASAETFAPVMAASKQPMTASRLRDEMARSDVDILEATEDPTPPRSKRGGWTEMGRLDELGHSLQGSLVRQIDAEVEAIAERIGVLLEHGWKRVRVVTDHGWLLLPGGLPKVDLPKFLVATKWARCAAVQGESSPAVPVFAWHWDAHARIACPPGIGAFASGVEYAHGGVSLQECVVPEIVVERAQGAARAQITEVQWRGMRCRVTVDTNAAGLRVELRRNWKQPDSESQRIAPIKELGSNGQASLAVERDEYEGTAAMAVVLDRDGRVLDYRTTTIGEK